MRAIMKIIDSIEFMGQGNHHNEGYTPWSPELNYDASHLSLPLEDQGTGSMPLWYVIGYFGGHIVSYN